MQWSPFRVDGVPFTGANVNDSLDLFMPLNEQEWERHYRHITEAFIPSFTTEHRGFRLDKIDSTYPMVPDWYEKYETPYSFAHETSPMVAYHGSRMMGEQNGPEWVIFLNEQLIMQAAALVHWARAWRLYWLSPHSVQGIKRLGLTTVCFGDNAIADQLGNLLAEIERIRWDKIPEIVGDQPQHAGRLTPVYLTGDWVPFDANAWCSHLENVEVQAALIVGGAMYLPLNDAGYPAIPNKSAESEHTDSFQSSV